MTAKRNLHCEPLEACDHKRVLKNTHFESLLVPMSRKTHYPAAGKLPHPLNSLPKIAATTLRLRIGMGMTWLLNRSAGLIPDVA